MDSIRKTFVYYIKRFFFWFTMLYNFKVQEIPLYAIYSRLKFDLADTNYNFSALYESLLKTGGLDLKNHPPIMVCPLFWEGGEDDFRKQALEQDFRYLTLAGDHRVATLQFINLSKKLEIYGPKIMIKVVVLTQEYYTKLDRYNYLDYRNSWGNARITAK